MSQMIAARSESLAHKRAAVRLRISNSGVASASVADVLRTPEAKKQIAAVSQLREATSRAKK